MTNSPLPYQLERGDVLAVLRTLPDNSFDSIVTDPPYELGFMGKGWDKSGIANNPEMWAEAMRVLKPGGHLLAFSGSRTYHRMACAIEDGGFDIRDQIMWVYGSGFPKSMNVAKAITGKEMGFGSNSAAIRRATMGDDYEPSGVRGNRDGVTRNSDTGMFGRDLPSTDAARQWKGWGTALKPAHEPICVARKPLIGTVAANVLAYGTGALNIDGCRVGWPDGVAPEIGTPGWGGPAKKLTAVPGQEGQTVERSAPSQLGRWPGNLIHDGSVEVLTAFPDAKGQQGRALDDGAASGNAVYGALRNVTTYPEPRIELDTSAARFFYCAKASRADRNEGLPSGDTPAVATDATMRECEDADWSKRNGNHHPTVKPTDLMAYLCRLITPPGGKVLDLFFGSGSTGKACMREGFEFYGIDKDEDENGRPAGFLEIATARIEHERLKVLSSLKFSDNSAAPLLKRPAPPRHPELFPSEMEVI